MSSKKDVRCSYCNDKKVIEIHNAYDPDFCEKEPCPICSGNEVDVLLN